MRSAIADYPQQSNSFEATQKLRIFLENSQKEDNPFFSDIINAATASIKVDRELSDRDRLIDSIAKNSIRYLIDKCSSDRAAKGREARSYESLISSIELFLSGHPIGENIIKKVTKNA
ncbi:MAG: hypothetical protein H7X92_05525 [Chitinophagales bacterium]|nr:hypothetical protein [Hyphomicrobiales bacterium]